MEESTWVSVIAGILAALASAIALLFRTAISAKDAEIATLRAQEEDCATDRAALRRENSELQEEKLAAVRARAELAEAHRTDQATVATRLGEIMRALAEAEARKGRRRGEGSD